MAIASLPALDAVRDAARAEVHKRAASAGVKAAEPFGLASAMWGEAVGDLIADIQDMFQLTPAQRAELEPTMLRDLSGLIGHYAPAATKAGTLTAMLATLRGSSLARRAATGVGARAASRLARGRGAAALAARTVLRRAWVVPLALGGGTAALYEILGRRCVNACHAYLHARIVAADTPAVAAPAAAGDGPA